jgi:hypothetical protein
MAITDQTWREHAACKGKPSELWFPNFPVTKKDRAAIAESVRICGTCPVAVECLDYSLEWEAAGTWGGVTERARNRMRKERNIILKSSIDAVPMPTRRAVPKIV